MSQKQDFASLLGMGDIKTKKINYAATPKIAISRQKIKKNH